MKKKVLLVAVLAAVVLLAVLLAACSSDFKVLKKGYIAIEDANSSGTIASDGGKYFLYNEKGKQVFSTGYDEMKFVNNAEIEGTSFLLVKNSEDAGYSLLKTDGSVIFASSNGMEYQDVEFAYDSAGNMETQVITGYTLRYIAVRISDADSNIYYQIYNASGSMIAGNVDTHSYTLLSSSTVDGDMASNTQHGFYTVETFDQSSDSLVKVYNLEGTCIYNKSFSETTRYSGISHLNAGRVIVSYTEGTGGETVYKKDYIDGTTTTYNASSHTKLTDADGNYKGVAFRTEDGVTVLKADGTKASVDCDYFGTVGAMYYTRKDTTYTYYDGSWTQKLSGEFTLSSIGYGKAAFYYSASTRMVYNSNLENVYKAENTLSIKTYTIIEDDLYYVAQVDDNFIFYKNSTQITSLSTSAYIYDASTGNLAYFKLSGTDNYVYIDITTGNGGAQREGSQYGSTAGRLSYYVVKETVDEDQYVTEIKFYHGTTTKEWTYGTSDEITNIDVSGTRINSTNVWYYRMTFSFPNRTEYRYYMVDGQSATDSVQIAGALVEVYRDTKTATVKSYYDSDNTVYLAFSPSDGRFGPDTKGTSFIVVTEADGKLSVANKGYLDIVNATFTKGYFYGEAKNKLDKVYNFAGNQVLNPVYDILSMTNEYAVVSYDGNTYGLLKFSGNAYKIIEKLGKHIHINTSELENGFYAVASEKNGIITYTLKDLDGKKIVDKVSSFENLGAEHVLGSDKITVYVKLIFADESKILRLENVAFEY